MATKKKKSSSTKRKGTRRHHKVGAMAMKLNAGSPLVQLGSAGVGFLVADTINAQIDKVAGTMDKKIIGALEGGVGAALMFMKFGTKPKSLPEVVIGGVLAGAGLKRLLQAFGIINGIGGYQSLPVLARAGQRHLNGYASVPVIGRNGGGYTTSRSAMNGTPGFTTSRAPQNLSNQVMGSAGGSDYNNGSGSDLMG